MGKYKLPKAFLVDMDGTMIDTEKFWIQAEIDTVGKFGKTMPHDLSLKLIGACVAHSSKLIIEVLGLDATPEYIANEIIDNVVRAMTSGQLQWRPGAKELLIYANKNNIPIVLVTSSFARVAQIFVNKAKEVDGKGFDFYIAGDMVQNPKPNPQPYLLAAEKLGCDISECIILEDSNTGAKAGVSSGGKTVSIPFIVDIDPMENLSFVNSICDLTPENIDKILRGEVLNLVDDSK